MQKSNTSKPLENLRENNCNNHLKIQSGHLVVHLNKNQLFKIKLHLSNLCDICKLSKMFDQSKSKLYKRVKQKTENLICLENFHRSSTFDFTTYNFQSQNPNMVLCYAHLGYKHFHTVQAFNKSDHYL